MMKKTKKMTETENYSSESTQRGHPMNTNMTGFRCFLKFFASLAKVASALEGLKKLLITSLLISRISLHLWPVNTVLKNERKCHMTSLSPFTVILTAAVESPMANVEEKAITCSALRSKDRSLHSLFKVPEYSWRLRLTTNVNHWIPNQQVSRNSLDTTHSPDIDKNRSGRYILRMLMRNLLIVKTIWEPTLVFVC